MNSLPHLSILNGPERPFTPIPIHKLIEKIAKGPVGGETALIFEEKEKIIKYTYSQMDQMSNKLSQVILENTKKCEGDNLIAVNMDPSENLILILLAIWKTGSAYLPLDHFFPQSKIDKIINESKPILLICDDEPEKYKNTKTLSWKSLNDLAENKTGSALEETEINDLALIIYTSGTTGTPKGVKIPHEAILNRLNWQFERFPYSKTEKVTVFKTVPTFGDSIAEIWAPLVKGLSLLIIPRNMTKNLRDFIDILHKYKIERLVLVPSLLQNILMYYQMQNRGTILNNLKLWVCSGEVLSVHLAKEFFLTFTHGPRLCNFYGSTETMADVVYQVFSRLEEIESGDSVPIGTPVNNTIIYLLDPDLKPVKEAEIGELSVSGLSLAMGYLTDIDKDKFLKNHLSTDQTMSKLYRTGDLARLQNGVLWYEGRSDSQVKIRGKKVDLREIENVTANINGVESVVVLCYKPNEKDVTLLAFIACNLLLNENQIEDSLKKVLVDYKVPQVIIVDRILLLENGKIDRKGLLNIYENTDFKDIDYTGINEEELPTARILFETVASVLKRSARSAICSKANFFEIGGNSLNSISTITKLNKLGYEISIQNFLTANDLGQLLKHMISTKNLQC